MYELSSPDIIPNILFFLSFFIFTLGLVLFDGGGGRALVYLYHCSIHKLEVSVVLCLPWQLKMHYSMSCGTNTMLVLYSLLILVFYTLQPELVKRVEKDLLKIMAGGTADILAQDHFNFFWVIILYLLQKQDILKLLLSKLLSIFTFFFGTEARLSHLTVNKL